MVSLVFAASTMSDLVLKAPYQQNVPNTKLIISVAQSVANFKLED